MFGDRNEPDAAANEDEPTTASALLADPLLAMTVASGVLFAILAALIAST
jgi:hypothetical protein